MPGLPEAAEKEGLEPLQYMRKYGCFEVKRENYTPYANEIEVPKGGVNGAILVQGGRFGGWGLYVKDGVPAYDYNFLGLQRFTIAAK